MSPLPTINRFAVILLPTQACLDWIKSCPGGDSCPILDELRREPTVYLIPEGKAEPESYVRRHFKAMFEAELGSWYSDPALWTAAISFENFKRFFEVRIGSMVFDLGPGPIIKEG